MATTCAKYTYRETLRDTIVGAHKHANAEPLLPMAGQHSFLLETCACAKERVIRGHHNENDGRWVAAHALTRRSIMWNPDHAQVG